MFDAEDDEDDIQLGICRDETCGLEYVHPSHIYPLHAQDQRGRPQRPWWEQKDPLAFKRPDPRGLREAVQGLFSETGWPLAFADVKNTVRNRYGSVSVRSLHRHLRRLIDAEYIIELDLQLAFSAYIRSDSRFLADRDNLREHMEGRFSAPRRSRTGIGRGDRSSPMEPTMAAATRQLRWLVEASVAP
jgi:hypothetical protein